MQVMRGLAMAGVGEFIQIGILTSSDRASSGEYEDLSGPAIRCFFEEALLSEWKAVSIVVADEQEAIEAALIDLIDVKGCSLVVTTGGTGPAPRDVTPDATEAVCSRMLPGFGEQMRAVSLRYVPTAILSRQSAGIRGQALIINLPGAPKAIRETIDEIFAAVPYCIDLIGGPYIETDPAVVDAFRPKHARR
jgi:molybdopterin adenylyltransferase